MSRFGRKTSTLLTALLLSLALTLPSLALADHLHDDPREETSCELCSMSGSAAPNEVTKPVFPRKETTSRQEKPRWMPFETYRLTDRQRGPPLLR